MLYNSLLSYFGAMQEYDLKIKACEPGAGGKKNSSVYHGSSEIQRLCERRYREKCSVLERATSSPTSDALIFISLLTVARLISSHLFRCSLLSGSLVSAGQAELLEDVLTRRRGGCSVLTVHSGDMW